MTRLEIAREQTTRLTDRLLPVLDDTARRIDPAQLDFRPTPETMSARQMVHHVYEVVLMTYRSVELGRLEREDLEFLALDEADARNADDLVAWGDRVKDYARRVAAELTEERLDRTVRFHFGMEATGWEALRTAHEEALHHRGQLMVYLRLLGGTPPRI